MKVGDKVLCIDGRFNHTWIVLLHVDALPKEGEIYTIRDVYFSEGLTRLHLEEVINDKVNTTDGIQEPGFLPCRFILWNPEEEEVKEEKAIKFMYSTKN